MKKTFIVHVLSEPTEGQEDAFNEYYEHTHLDEVLATAGWKSAQRYKLRAELGTEGCPLPYLAAYEAQAESAEEVLEQMAATRHLRQQSAALNKRTARVWVYEATGPLHSREQNI
jgi:Ser/Thr protein kinase RdoA (MazF antagonist)